jgi:hypothetical protein
MLRLVSVRACAATILLVGILMSGSPASGDEISAKTIANHVGAILKGDGPIRKWPDPIRFRIHGLDDAGHKVLSDVFPQFAPAMGLSVSESFDRQNNLLLVFTDDIPLYANDEWVKKMFKGRGEDDKEYVDRFSRELVRGSRRWMANAEDGRIVSVVEFVYTPTTLPASTAAARAARLAGIVFRNLTHGAYSDFLPSVTNSNHAFAAPTPADIAFVRALYDPEIGFNMSETEAVPIIARKMSEQLLQRR